MTKTIIYLLLLSTSLFAQQEPIIKLDQLEPYYKQYTDENRIKALLGDLYVEEPKIARIETILEQQAYTSEQDRKLKSTQCYEEKIKRFNKHVGLYSNTIDEINSIKSLLERYGYVKKLDTKAVFYAVLNDSEVICSEGVYSCLSSTADFQYLAKKANLESYVLVFDGHFSNLIKDRKNNNWIIVDFYYSASFPGTKTIISEPLDKAEYFLKIALGYSFIGVSEQQYALPQIPEKNITPTFKKALNSQEFMKLVDEYMVVYDKLSTLEETAIKINEVATALKALTPKEEKDIIKTLDETKAKKIKEINEQKLPLEKQANAIHQKALEIFSKASLE